MDVALLIATIGSVGRRSIGRAAASSMEWAATTPFPAGSLALNHPRPRPEQQHHPRRRPHAHRRFCLAYYLGAELLNFGALVAFMGVNVSLSVRYYLRGQSQGVARFRPAGPGLPGLPVALVNLGPKAKIAGGVWLAAGLLYGASRTSGSANLWNFKMWRFRR